MESTVFLAALQYQPHIDCLDLFQWEASLSMQIRAEKCNPSLKLGRAPIEFGAENLHKHQKGKKKKQKKKLSSADRKASLTV